MAMRIMTPSGHIPSSHHGENIERGHAVDDTQERDAAPTNQRRGHISTDTQLEPAPSRLKSMDGGYRACDTHDPPAPVHLQTQSRGQNAIDTHSDRAPAHSNNVEGQKADDTQSTIALDDSNNCDCQTGDDTQRCDAITDSNNDDRGQPTIDTQTMTAPDHLQNLDGGGHTGCDTQCAFAPAVFADIRHHYRLRVDYHKAEKSLTLQCKALLRRLCDGDKDEANKMFKVIEGGHTSGDTHSSTSLLIALAVCEPFLTSRALFKTYRKVEEKTIVKLVKTLSVWEWVEARRGIGALSFACIVGETGDLNNYATVSKVWKRLGLAVIQGQRQRNVTDKELAIEMGYSASRRAVVWNIGEGFVKQGEYYRELYLKFLADEATDKATKAGLIPTTTGKATAANWEARGLPKLTVVKEHDPKLHRCAAHMNARAKRRMEKEFIIDLWCEWTGNSRSKAKK